MRAVQRVVGTACPLDRADIDTDQIIPKQFLKRIDRTGFGPHAFHAWRYDGEGREIADFPMNREEHRDAAVLVTGPNFGCGSSREHAVWALDDAGFRAVIAPSFADIFRTNCTKVGVLTVELPAADVQQLLVRIEAHPGTEVTIDLPTQTVVAGDLRLTFDIDQHTKHRLVEGLDDVGSTLGHEGAIADYERRRPPWRPRIA